MLNVTVTERIPVTYDQMRMSAIRMRKIYSEPFKREDDSSEFPLFILVVTRSQAEKSLSTKKQKRCLFN
ncbi:hypothetical protein DICVIV_08563 [Dictyocaulus viviparus]|uniref:Uncharacterized protein n=1 Tax=Dictyocaulus viviparus TaxID=29172 RepID=A0A0D8XSP8_DICVI|nr:hypothetical protein DICVIV_08563 [Dictyocaulus viviparus]